MNPRAADLARTLLARLQALELALLDDAAPSDDEEAHRREELVATVLSGEARITDPATALAIARAVPQVFPDREPTDNEVAALAEVLEAHGCSPRL